MLEEGVPEACLRKREKHGDRQFDKADHAIDARRNRPSFAKMLQNARSGVTAGHAQAKDHRQPESEC